MRFPVLCAVVAAAFIAAMAGCEWGKEKPTGPLQGGASPMLSDIPVPQGFGYDASRSVSDLGRGYRVAKLLYKGDAPVQSVIQFYKEQMPANGWAEQRDLHSGDEVAMYFSKKDEHCTITIRRGGLIPSTTVRIQVP